MLSAGDLAFMRGLTDTKARFFPSKIFGDGTTKLVINKAINNPVTLYDDGTHGDDSAGDGLFSRACITMSDLSLEYDQFDGLATSYHTRGGFLHIVNPSLRGTIEH